MASGESHPFMYILRGMEYEVRGTSPVLIEGEDEGEGEGEGEERQG